MSDAGPFDPLRKVFDGQRRDRFARLSLLRDFEPFLARQIERLRLQPLDEAGLRLVDELARDYRGFDSADEATRRRLMERWCLRLDEVLEPSSPVPVKPASPPESPTPPPDTPVQFLKGVGPKRAQALEARGLRTLEDLLLFFPRNYRDLGDIRRIVQLEEGQIATLIGTVLASGEVRRGRTGRRMFEVVVGDGSGQISLKWFNYPPQSLKERFFKGRRFFITGKVGRYHTQREMHHPETEWVDEEEGAAQTAPTGIQPLYATPEGWPPLLFRRAMAGWVGEAADHVADPLPETILRKERWPTKAAAIRFLHHPPDDASFEDLIRQRTAAHRRLIFEEFFLLQLAMGRRRQERRQVESRALAVDDDTFAGFLSQLPFELTRAQRKVSEEIRADMEKPVAMHRLIQGDVGSGKTAVAFLAARIAVARGGQAALMAPTELLAEQHYRTLSDLGRAAGIEIGLLTGSTGAVERRQMIARLAGGRLSVVVGTHALIQEGIEFKDLALAVVDEQHRFGVAQRAALQEKGHPHGLVMTATPIPRTLAMTVYGDLDSSVIDELPPGRSPVMTRVVYEKDRARLYAWIDEELGRGRQAYFIYPLVAESEKIDLRDATRMAEQMRREIFANRRVGLLHGQLPPEEKESVMADFKDHRIDLLVATTVIEVGIDVPNATLMVVEHAERFGLSQLHQLRGRVGRGPIQSHCLLMVDYASTDEARFRLKTMEETNDGFRIAEADLELRGPGEFLGRRQSGLPEFRLGNLIRDTDLLTQARAWAGHLLDADPSLRQYPELAQAMRTRWEHFRLASVG